MAMERQRRGRDAHRVARWLACAALMAPACPAFGASTLEYQVKAVFLLNFTKFIDWPAGAFADSGAPFTMCILGDDAFEHVLDDVVAGETVRGRPLIVRRITQPPGPQACQILFVSPAENSLSGVLRRLSLGMLTVGEGEAFVRDGGIIAFVLDNRRVRFDINQTAAERASLKLSSKLLSVARSVRNDKGK